MTARARKRHEEKEPAQLRVFIREVCVVIPDTIILTERRDHSLSVKSFDQLLAKDLKARWNSFSDQTKEDIWRYFHYLRGLVEVHDTDNYDRWTYWQKTMTRFVRGFDETKPYYDGNFGRVVLSAQVPKTETE